MSGERTSTEAPTSELRTALAHTLSDHFGSERRVVGLERRPSPFRTSFPLEELELELEDRTRLRLVLKDLSRETLSDRARKAKPEFLYDPLREIETYRDLLEPAGLGTAAYYGSDVEPARQRYWLFLENVSGPALWQVGELSVWEEAARWLASMHRHFTDRGHERPGSLVRYDAAFYRRWPARAQEFAKRGGRSREIDWLAYRYEPVVERLTALPAIFVHGEFYASNVLVSEGTGRPRICPIDWEIAGVGPGMLDLAALTTGEWSDAERRALALAYREASESPSVPVDDFLNTLDYCYLHLAVQWLGWSPDWRPPRAHRRDWLGEALRMAEKLGL